MNIIKNWLGLVINSIDKVNQRFFNADLLFLALSVIMVNVPMFDGTIVPAHDTMYQFNVFHYFYTEFLFNSEIPQWVLYGIYGAPSDFYQLTGLTPTNYFFGLIGAILNIKDVLFLFKMAVLFDHLIYLVGIYLLSRILFVHRATTFIVCLGAILSTVWITQIYWNLRIVYLIPFVIYFLLNYFKQRQPVFMWLAGIVSVISLLGSVLYFAPIFLFIISIICFVCFLKDKASWRYVFSLSYSNIIIFSLFIIISSAFLYFVFESLKFVSILHAGRADNLKINLISYLTHGIDLIKSFRLPEFVSGMRIYHQAPIVVYIGLLPLIFFLWGFVKVRKTSFLVISSVTFALIWLSIGGGFSVLVYYFPAMSNFRHLGHLYGLIKIFILLCAGFGVDHFYTIIEEETFYNRLCKNEVFKTHFSLFRLGIIVIILLFIIDIFITYHFNNISTPKTKELDVLSGMFFGFRVATYAFGVGLVYHIIRRQTLSSALFIRAIKIIMIACFIVDLFSFQIMVYLSTPKLSPSLVSTLDTLKANQVKFQKQRTNKPYNMRQKKAMALITRDYPYRNANMELTYNFLKLDPCYPEFWTLFYSAGVDKLIKIRGGEPKENPHPLFLPKKDHSLLRVLGCTAPKLRLVSNAIFVNDLDQAANKIENTPNIDTVVFLRGKVTSPLTNLDPEKIRHVSADSSNGDSFNAKKAFDKRKNTFWETSKSFPHWIQCSFFEKKKIKQYSLHTSNHGKDSTDRMPMDWNFQGSNDEENWTTLDIRKNQINWKENEKREYDFSSQILYQFYRLNIIKGVQPNILRLYEIGLSEESPPVQLLVAPIINGKISVTKFSSNKLVIQANVPTNKPAWLIYADSFHPNWIATVNGKNSHIFEANLAFKAVKLEKGDNVIRFKFFNGLTTIVSYLIAILSIVFVSIISIVFFWEVFLKKMNEGSKNILFLRRFFDETT